MNGAYFSTIVRNQPQRKETVIIALALLLLTVIALMPSAPILYRTPDIDSGVFLYMGSQILDGAVPYRDMWDHKPPLVFFINALGLAIKGNGRWGVWALEVAAVSAAGFLLFGFLRRFFGRFPALFGVAAFLGNLIFVNEYGNLPEEYGLPLQAVILVVLAGALSRKRADLHYLAIGVFLGLAASLKQTLLGVGVVAVLCILVTGLWSRNWRMLLGCLLIGVGFSAVWGIWAVYFWSQNALLDFWNQTIYFNFFYAGVSNIDRVQSLRAILSYLYRSSGFFILGTLTWLIVLPYLFVNDVRVQKAITSRWMGAAVLLTGLFFLFNGLWDDRTGGLYSLTSLSSYRWLMIGAGLVFAAASAMLLTGWVWRVTQGWYKRLQPSDCSGLLLPLSIAFLGLPVELALSSFSGRDYYHYYVPLLPVLSVLIAFLVWSISAAQYTTADRLSVWSWLAVLSLPVIFAGWFTTMNAIRRTETLNVQQAVNFIQHNSQLGEGILQWGTNERLHFLTGRPAVSRYIYQQPLFTSGYVTSEKVEQFLADLQKTPPAVIVDTRPEKMPLVWPEQSCADAANDEYVTGVIRKERDARFPLAAGEPLPYVPPEMKRVYSWLCENYEMVPASGSDPDSWRYFQPRQPRP